MLLRFVDVGGTRIALRDSGGSGVPVVLLHGNSCSSRAFRHQFDAGCGLRGVRVIALDFPGHGDSAPAAEPSSHYSLPGLATVVVELADRLGVSSAVFIGWSLGGHVLLEAAGQLTEARGFCIFGAPPLSGLSDMGQAFLPHPAIPDLFKEQLMDDDVRLRVSACFRPGAPLPEEFIEDVRRSEPSFRPALLASLSTVGFLDETDVVHTLRRPIAVFHGAHEQVVNGDYVAALPMPTLWRGRVQAIAGAGHSPHWETPSVFNALVEDFVGDVAS